MKDVAASAGITSKKFELFTQGATKFNFSAQIKSLQRFNFVLTFYIKYNN